MKRPKRHRWEPVTRRASPDERAALRRLHFGVTRATATHECQRCGAARVEGVVPVAPGYAHTVHAVVRAGFVVDGCVVVLAAVAAHVVASRSRGQGRPR